MIVPFYIYHQRPDPIKNKVTNNIQIKSTPINYTLSTSKSNWIGTDVLNLLVDNWLDKTALIGCVSALYLYINMHYTVWTATNLLNDDIFGRTDARFRNIVFTIGTTFPSNHSRNYK